MADMIRADLERAGIDYLDAEGRVFDFHSLRGQYITELGRSGAPQVVVQKLARHADFSTTKRYLDITLADESAAVERLPTIDMTPASNQEMLATDTDDVPVDPSTNGSASGSISVVPGYHDVSSHVTDDAGQSGTQDRSASDDNSLEASNYDTTCPDVSQHVNDERDQATRRTRTVNLRITNALPAFIAQRLTNPARATDSTQQTAGDLMALALARALAKLEAKHRQTILAMLPPHEREAVVVLTEALGPVVP